MLPRLRAERARELIDAMLVVQGRHASDTAYKQHIAYLDRQINGDHTQIRRSSTAVKAVSLTHLSRQGIRVIRENRVAASAITTSKPGDRPGLKKKQTPAPAE